MQHGSRKILGAFGALSVAIAPSRLLRMTIGIKYRSFGIKCGLLEERNSAYTGRKIIRPYDEKMVDRDWLRSRDGAFWSDGKRAAAIAKYGSIFALSPESARSKSRGFANSFGTGRNDIRIRAVANSRSD